ncbi:MAG TPA: DUF4234 domain-containing protein [Verrucomicrobiae bacterium]|nr:DUF4234 domain-containing protein [Verrucomicrobiae bacterium]
MKYRNPVIVILLSIITLGIYILYWLYDTRKEMVQKGIKLPAVWVLLVPIPVSIAHVLLTSFVSLFLNEASGAYHLVNLVLFPILATLVVCSIIPLTLWWVWKYCAGVQAATNGHLTRGAAYKVFCLLFLFGIGFLWPMIIQNYFNSERHT